MMQVIKVLMHINIGWYIVDLWSILVLEKRFYIFKFEQLAVLMLVLKTS